MDWLLSRSLSLCHQSVRFNREAGQRHPVRGEMFIARAQHPRPAPFEGGGQVLWTFHSSGVKPLRVPRNSSQTEAGRTLELQNEETSQPQAAQTFPAAG